MNYPGDNLLVAGDLYHVVTLFNDTGEKNAIIFGMCGKPYEKTLRNRMKHYT